MLNILLSGASGAMGANVRAAAGERDDVTIVAGVDKKSIDLDFPVYTDFKSVKETVDVIIDFSVASLTEELLAFAVKRSIPLVIATTGHSQKQLEAIAEAARQIPIFKTANFSVGVNVLCALVNRAAKALSGFDIEIIEKHHHNKLDAPSGTALMLAEAANNAKGGSLKYEFDRHSKRAKREENEIGIHSVRGGTIVGEHDVLFAGENESVVISHKAESRAVFAAGAIKAAVFTAKKSPGLYDMNDLLGL